MSVCIIFSHKFDEKKMEKWFELHTHTHTYNHFENHRGIKTLGKQENFKFEYDFLHITYDYI